MSGYCYKCNLMINPKDFWYGVHKACFLKWFELPTLEEFQDVAAKYWHKGSDSSRAINSTFFHGKFRKYSALLGKTNIS